jgi:hypothetical protein
MDWDLFIGLFRLKDGKNNFFFHCCCLFLLIFSYFTSDLQNEFHNRVVKELKTVLRNAEKLRERFSQRLMKYTKSLQDKRTRDKLTQSKAISDTSLVIHSYTDKLNALYMKEMQSFVRNLKEKLIQGQQLSSSQGDKPEVREINCSSFCFFALLILLSVICLDERK